MLWAALGLLTLLWLASSGLALKHLPRALTQEDIDAAVLKTLNTVPLPSPAAKAYETIAPSVVRVTSYVHKSRLKTDKNGKPVESNSLALSTDPENPDEVEMGVGTGVVIVDKGVILTNLHVVQGADRIMVTFSDGLRAQADVTGAQPENDLAVLQARKIPDDLFAATMKSTAELAPGEQVLAVGAAIENLILAARAAGLGTMWKTGGAAYDPTVKHALGLADTDQVAGFIHVGWPTEMKPVRAVDIGGVTRWVSNAGA